MVKYPVPAFKGKRRESSRKFVFIAPRFCGTLGRVPRFNSCQEVVSGRILCIYSLYNSLLGHSGKYYTPLKAARFLSIVQGPHGTRRQTTASSRNYLLPPWFARCSHSSSSPSIN